MRIVHYVQSQSLLGSFPLVLSRCIRVYSNKNFVTPFLNDNSYDGKQVVHSLGNNGEEGKQQAHLHDVPKILPLAFSLSTMNTKVAPNILRRFSIQK